MLFILTRRWRIPLLKGICALLTGLTMVLWMRMPAIVFVVAFGIYCLADGALSFSLARNTQTRRNKLRKQLWTAGFLSICSAAVALLWFDMGVERMAVLVTQWALCRGLVEIITWLQIRRFIPHERFLLRIGLTSLLLNGAVLAAALLHIAAVQWIVGICLGFRGALFIALSMELHAYQSAYRPKRYIHPTDSIAITRRSLLRRIGFAAHRPSERQ